MKLIELHEKIERQLKVMPSTKDAEVVIKRDNKGMGPMNTVSIQDACFDWDKEIHPLYKK